MKHIAAESWDEAEVIIFEHETSEYPEFLHYCKAH